MMMDVIRQTAIRYYRKVTNHSKKGGLPKMAELAPGVVVIEEVSDCYAVFDKRWGFKNPECWEEVLRDTDLGLTILLGIGRFPPAATIAEMDEFAREALSPAGTATWHEAPMPF